MVKVIAILSNKFSGSTITDFILGSHSKGLSTTELHAYVRGARTPFHCQNCTPPESCPVWTPELTQKLMEMPLTNAIYDEISQQTSSDFIVDSSKIINNWFSHTLAGIAPEDLVCVHISKSPEEYAGSSRAKIGKDKIENINEIIDSWWSVNAKILDFVNGMKCHKVYVRYRDVVDFPQAAIEHILSKIGYHYESNMENYWNYHHHPLWGNSAARSQLSHSTDTTKLYANYSKVNQELYSNNHQSLFRDQKWRDLVSSDEIDLIYGNKSINRMAKLLHYANPNTLEGQQLNEWTTYQPIDVYQTSELRNEQILRHSNILLKKVIRHLSPPVFKHFAR